MKRIFGGDKANFKLNKFNKALQDFDAIIKTSPIEADPYYFKAKCFIELQETDKALNYLNQAISINSNYIYYLERAKLFSNLKKI